MEFILFEREISFIFKFCLINCLSQYVYSTLIIIYKFIFFAFLKISVRDVEKTLALRSPPPASSGRNSAQQSQTIADLIVRFDCPQVPPVATVNGVRNSKSSTNEEWLISLAMGN